ncbi:hypothetical protein VPHD480_0392 [Vibrio phage D480]
MVTLCVVSLSAMHGIHTPRFSPTLPYRRYLLG